MSKPQITVHKLSKLQNILREVKIFFQSLIMVLVAIPDLVSYCDTILRCVYSMLSLTQVLFSLTPLTIYCISQLVFNGAMGFLVNPLGAQ